MYSLRLRKILKHMPNVVKHINSQNEFNGLLTYLGFLNQYLNLQKVNKVKVHTLSNEDWGVAGERERNEAYYSGIQNDFQPDFVEN